MGELLLPIAAPIDPPSVGVEISLLSFIPSFQVAFDFVIIASSPVASSTNDFPYLTASVWDL